MNMFKGFTVIDVTSFQQDGEVIDRVVLDVNGHDVQIVSYDNSPCVCVKIDDQVEMMDMSLINQFIRSNT